MIKVQRNSKGFTLIELLIVIAIIGILAAIAVPAYTGYTKKAKVGEVIHAMGAIKNSVAVYYAEAGAAVVAGTAADIKTNYGVDVPTNRALFQVAADGTITATLQAIGADVDATTLTLTTADFKTWAWGGTLPASYKPKG